MKAATATKPWSPDPGRLGLRLLQVRLAQLRPGDGAKTIAEYRKPYQQMWDELQKLDRDIVFNLCQYGRGNEVWKWGGEVGHCWRTTGDLGLARWPAARLSFPSASSTSSHWLYARPGAWNDPDYILIGWVGDAAGMGEGRPTTLTPDEQYAYMSMWCLMAAPLIYKRRHGPARPLHLERLVQP